MRSFAKKPNPAGCTDVEGLVFFGYMDWKKLSDMDPSDDVPVDED